MTQTQENAVSQEAIAVADQIFPSTTSVKLFDGREVEVYKIKMKHNGFMLRLVQKLVQELGVDDKGDISISLEDKPALLKLISKFPDDINQLIAMLSSLSLAEVEELETDDGLRVIIKIGGVNKAFFLERVAPVLASVNLQNIATGITAAPQVTKTIQKS